MYVCFAGCERESSVTMWIYVFLGNVLRGIGETPVQPLGISYVDDYAQPENAAFYIGNAFQDGRRASYVPRCVRTHLVGGRDAFLGRGNVCSVVP